MSRPCWVMLIGPVLAGCVTAPPAGQPAAPPARMVLTWHQNPGVLPEAVADFEALASRIAGVPVKRLAAIDERKIAISLDCGGPVACESARRRLLADRRIVDLVVDDRAGLHPSPQRTP